MRSDAHNAQAAAAIAARFAVFESVLPPSLLSQQAFRAALEAAYDRLAMPHSALTPELS